MDDLIKRSDAIEAIRKARTSDAVSYQYADLFINALCRVPSADRPQVEWVRHKNAEEICGTLISNYECSLCHEWQTLISNYCPNCGCRMKGADDESVDSN